MDRIMKYKWLYLWIAAAGLLTLGLIMILNQEFGQAVVLIITGIIFILSVVIRIVPLLRTLRGWGAKLLNIIALVLDLLAGVAIIIIVGTAQDGDVSSFNAFFPFLIGGVLFFQGLVYLIEATFLGTKGEVPKFIIHVLLLTLGTVIMSRFDTFTVDYFRLFIGVAFLLCFAFATVDGIFHYDRYRKKYVIPKKNEKANAAGINWAESATVTESKKVPEKMEIKLAAGAENQKIPDENESKDKDIDIPDEEQPDDADTDKSPEAAENNPDDAGE